MKPRSPFPLSLSAAIYRYLLMVYPPAHRRDYGWLMLQLFRDQSQDSYAQGGVFELIRLWFRTMSDLAQSAVVAYWSAIEEVLMAVPSVITPMSWRKVVLVVAPGILFGFSRIYAPLGGVTLVSILLIAMLAVASFGIHKSLPAWGLLVLGAVTNWLLTIVVVGLPDVLKSRLGVNFNTSQLLLAIPVWLAILVLAWKSKIIWRLPLWNWVLLFIGVLGAFTFRYFTVISTAGLLLLPIALGIPLARRHGSLAALFVVGAFSVLFLDSDTISGYLLQDQAFYRYYAILIYWLFFSIAPLLFLRARSPIGRTIGLLAPAAVVLIGRVVVPWLVVPDSHPLYIWTNSAFESAFILLLLWIALRLYGGIESPAEPAEQKGRNRPEQRPATGFEIRN